MSRFPESFTAMKEVAPGASLTDGKQTTRPFLTDSETGSASEKQGGSPPKRKGRIAPAFCAGSPCASYQVRNVHANCFAHVNRRFALIIPSLFSDQESDTH